MPAHADGVTKYVLQAKLDPLGRAPMPRVPDLDPAFHGLGAEDMDTVFNTGSLAAADRLPLKEIIRIIRAVYTETIGAEYMYLTETDEKRWIQKRLEPMAFQPKLSVARKLEVLRQLVAAEGLERYLHKKYVGQKRFSLEGGDALIPALDEVLHACADRDVEEIVIGMAHRGRLNVLINILGKSPKDLFAEFEGKYSEEALKKAGDVKYHMGFSTDVEVAGKRLHLVLAESAPDLVVYLAGADPHAGDRLGVVHLALAVHQQIEGVPLFADFAQSAVDVRGFGDRFGKRTPQLAQHLVKLVVQLETLLDASC